MQPDLFKTAPRFNGPADVYDPARDDARLTKQLGRVWEALKGGRWLTLRELERITGDPAASISAQVRHLRKPRFGSHQIDKQRRDGTNEWQYRLVLPE